MSMWREIMGSTSIELVTNMSLFTTGVRNSVTRVHTNRLMHCSHALNSHNDTYDEGENRYKAANDSASSLV